MRIHFMSDTVPGAEDRAVKNKTKQQQNQLKS